MIRIPAAAFALVLFVIPYVVAPMKPVAVVGLLGLLLAGVGIGGLWRWPLTVGACLFLIEYAGALWVAGAPLGVGAAVGFGLALLLLLQSVELGRALRHATVDGRAVRTQITGWLGFVTATLGVSLLGLALARGLASSIPFAAAPVVAALAGLGALLALAAIVTGRPRV